MYLAVYSFILSGPRTTSQDSHHSLWVSIYSSLSHHFPNKVGDKAHPSSPKLCPVGGVPITTVFPGHPWVEQKSLHTLCTNFVLSVTGGPCTTGMSNRLNERPKNSRGGSHGSLHLGPALVWFHLCHFCLTINYWPHWTVCFWMPNRASFMMVCSGCKANSCPGIRCLFSTRVQEHARCYFLSWK